MLLMSSVLLQLQLQLQVQVRVRVQVQVPVLHTQHRLSSAASLCVLHLLSHKANALSCTCPLL